jgi:hypothetical protein
VNVIVEHPENPGLLFLGTEQALFVSTNGGGSWTRFTTLPTTLYDDLMIHPRDDDLVVGTHGRSIYILDDVAPLAEWSAEAASSAAHLFSVRPATIFQYWKDTSYRGQGAYAGENPPTGAILSYYLGRVADEVSIDITDASGDIVRSLDVPMTSGVIHRVSWDLRHEPPPFRRETERVAALPKLTHPITPRGPFVAPGTYTVTLQAGDARYSQSVLVRGDPLLALSDEEWRERETFLVDLLDLQRRAWDAEQRGDELSRQAAARRDSLGGEAAPPEAIERAASLAALARRLDRLRSRVYDLAEAFNGNGVRQASLYPPTETHRQRARDLEAALERELDALAGVAPGGP